MKILDGKELADFIKERQAAEIRGLARKPKLLILRDSDNPVIEKYVKLKIAYGEDIGAVVEEKLIKSDDELAEAIKTANADATIDGIILQLPIKDKDITDEITALIAPEKDVDGLSGHGAFDSATATAIIWLLAGYDIKLEGRKIAVIGRGKLVGAPLFKMWTNSHLDVELFHRGSDLTKLNECDIIVSATGSPNLILSEYVKPGAVVVDAGTASEKGILVGDLDESVRNREDLTALTPKYGGVGPLTVTCLFDHLIEAAKKSQN